MAARSQRILESIGLAVLLTLGIGGEEVLRGIYGGLFATPLLAIMVYRMWPWLQARREEAWRQEPPTWQEALKSVGFAVAVFVAVLAIDRWVFPGRPLDAWDAMRTLSFMAFILVTLIYPWLTSRQVEPGTTTLLIVLVAGCAELLIRFRRQRPA